MSSAPTSARLRARAGAGIAVLAVLLGGCGASHHPGSPSTGTSTAGWVDSAVSFKAGGMTVYGTLRHPSGPHDAVAAALLIAGSGPTDRNGNSTQIPGAVNTLRTLADWLSADGVASLRYDKLGTGQTGLGPYQTQVATITPTPFEQESDAALNTLAAQPGIDRHRLLVIGHSEGALYALVMAAHETNLPRIAGLGLVEPASRRSLDTLDEQLSAQVTAAEQSGHITATQAAAENAALTATIASLRSNGTVPTDIPPDLAKIFAPSTADYLAQIDRLDPAVLAAGLPSRLPVLLTCSNADVQITCDDVDHLAAGLDQAHAATDYVHLDGVDHILKQDTSHTGSHYGQPLPFSTQLRAALAAFLSAHQLR
jgi:hypothetical protein